MNAKKGNSTNSLLKLLLIMAALLALMVVISGCDEDDDADNDNSNQQATEAATEAATEEAVATEAATEEAVATEAATEEATVEAAPTEEATVEATEAATEEAAAPTEEAAAPTEEATIEAAPTEEAAAPTEEATEEAVIEVAAATEAATEEIAAPTEEATVEAAAPTEEATVEAAPTEEATAATPVPAGDLLTLVIGTTDDIAKLDPADAYAFHDWELLRNTNEGLLGFIPGEAVLEPRLATAFPTVSEDGLTYTATLRDDAKFPDGTVLTPEMYVASVKRAVRLEGDPFGLISVIAKRDENGCMIRYDATDAIIPLNEECAFVDDAGEPLSEEAAAEVSSHPDANVEAGENNTIVFTLAERYDLFPLILAQPTLYPAHPDLFAPDEMTNLPTTLQGVGAYQVTEYTVGERTVLEKNPNYYGEEGQFERIVIVYYEEPGQLDLAIEGKEIDMAWRSNTVSEIDRLDAITDLEVLRVPGGIRYLSFNHTLIPDLNIRQAIATAINRDELIDRAMSGEASPLYSMVPPGFLGANEAFLDNYGFGDAEAAKALFETAGYTEDNQFALDLWYPPNRYGGTVAQVIEVVGEQLEATGVVDVTIQSAEWSTYLPAALNGDYAFFFLGWFFDYPDSDNYLDPFAFCTSSAGLGINYCNTAMDALLIKERTEVADPDTRSATLVEIQNLYAADAVTIPLFYVEDFNIYDDTKVDNVLIGSPLQLYYRILQPVNP